MWEAIRQERQAHQPQQEQIEVVPMEPSKLPRASMQPQGWLRLKNPGQFGWYRKTGGGKNLIIYESFNGNDSLAFAWGLDLARKHLPRSFAVEIANDHGGLFATAFLNGFDSFSRPAKVERIRKDEEETWW